MNELDERFNKLKVTCDHVIKEYEEDFQRFAIDIHRDISNKFSSYDDFSQIVGSISVMRYLLFDQMCSLMATIDDVEFWEEAFSEMKEECVENCGSWLKKYKNEERKP